MNASQFLKSKGFSTEEFTCYSNNLSLGKIDLVEYLEEYALYKTQEEIINLSIKPNITPEFSYIESKRKTLSDLLEREEFHGNVTLLGELKRVEDFLEWMTTGETK